MIRVLDRTSSSEVDVETDDYYLPLKVAWQPRGPISLSLRISGSNGGEFEFWIDPETGALVDGIVLIGPPRLDRDPREISSDPPTPVRPGRPVMDLSWWRKEDGQLEELFEPIFISVPDVAWYRDEDVIVVRFCDEPVTNRILTGNVAVGVSAGQNLATLEVTRRRESTSDASH